MIKNLPLNLLLLVAFTYSAYVAAEQPSDEEALLNHASDPWKGDLEGMLERGFIRVLTTYNPLFFTFDGGEQRGLIVELTRAFEDHLKKTYGDRAKHLRVLLMPDTRDRLLKDLAAGKGDIVAANLTITPDRQKQANFSRPIFPDVSELVVTGPAAPKIKTFDDLVKTGLHVRESSSYYEHLKSLNQSRKKEDKQTIPIHKADSLLGDHDLMEMVNAGIIGATIVDSHKAELWGQVLEDITIHENLAVHTGRSIAWAVRKDTPELLEAVNGFMKTARKGTLLGNILINRYLKNTKWIEDVRDDDENKQHQQTLEIIKQYADRYDFDWLMIAAQAYQESKLDQSKRSPAGAVGVMQVRPSTAKDPNVDIKNIDKLENNIHAGVKYLRFIRDRYFSDEKIKPLDQILFSFAAYNAGPANINRARKKARAMGFDPNRWFGHVEVAASRTISREPVIYVRNIYKYYVAYRLIEDIRQEREAVLGASH